MGYPVWWNKTITVFNKYEDSTGQVAWYKHTLTGCFVKHEVINQAFAPNQVNIATASTLCRIPQNANYKNPGAWLALSGTQKSTYFTFKANDIVVEGTISDTIDEYTAGSRSSDLLKKYKDSGSAFVVERCSDNTNTGMGLKHYYVKGV